MFFGSSFRLDLLLINVIYHFSFSSSGQVSDLTELLINVVIVLEFAKEAFAELNDTAVSIIEDALGAPREGNKT